MGSSLAVSRSVLVAFIGSVVAATSLSACGGGGGSSDARVVPANFDFGACDARYISELKEIETTKAAPDFPKTANQTEWVRSDFFAKPYDRVDLEAVLNASIIPTALYVTSLGVNVQQIPREPVAGACPTYSFLKSAPAPLQTIWKEAAGGGSGEGKLAGLYFEYCGPGTGVPCSDREMRQPTILLDMTSDRWTLVHEMMHFNFNQGRKADLDMPSPNEIGRRLANSTKAFAAAMKDFTALPNEQDLQKAATALREMTDLSLEVGIRRDLEEVSIEGMLIDLWSSGRLTNVSSNSPASGVWYMTYSRDKFVGVLPPLEKSVAELQEIAKTNFWPIVEKDLGETETRLTTIRHDLDNRIETAKQQIKKVQKWVDEDQFKNNKGRVGVTALSDEIDFDFAAHEQAALDHLKSHDTDGLSDQLEAAINDIGLTLQNSR